MNNTTVYIHEQYLFVSVKHMLNCYNQCQYRFTKFSMPRTYPAGCSQPNLSNHHPPKKEHNSNHSTLKPCWSWKIIVSLWDETTLASYNRFKAQKQTPKIHQVPVEWLICTTCCGHRWRTSCKRLSMYTVRQSISAQKTTAQMQPQLWSTWQFEPKIDCLNLENATPLLQNILKHIISHFPNGISRTYFGGLGLQKKPWPSPLGSIWHTKFGNLSRHDLDHFLTYVK